MNRSGRIHLFALAACAAVFWLRAENVISGSSGWLLAGMICLILAAIATTAHGTLRLVPDWRWALASPLSMAAITWFTLFALRPAELNASPAETIGPLLGIGYGTADLSRTVAIGGVGCATWAIGFLVALSAIGLRGRRSAPMQDFSLRTYAPWVLTGIGFALSAALLARSGGISTLIHSPGDLHFNNSQSGFYGQLGAWILEGVALFSFASILQGKGDTRRAKWILLVSAGLAVSMNLALGSRGLLVFGVLAAGVVYLRLRAPSFKAVVAAIACLAALAGLLEFSAVVRTNSLNGSFLEGAKTSIHQSPASFQTADLSTFDDLVAMQKLVPSSITRMEGTSLLQIPAALAPRALWPGKPEPVDSRVTAYLYPVGNAAGSPITMQGELFWNFGIPAVAIGSMLIGLLMGWSMVLWTRSERISLLVYAVLVASVYALLTRALGTMVANTVIALVGVGFVAVTITPGGWQALRKQLLERS